MRHHDVKATVELPATERLPYPCELKPSLPLAVT
jgi:hypothetical protein